MFRLSFVIPSSWGLPTYILRAAVHVGKGYAAVHVGKFDFKRSTRSPRVQEWHKCAPTVECKRGLSTRHRLAPAIRRHPPGSGVPRAEASCCVYAHSKGGDNYSFSEDQGFLGDGIRFGRQRFRLGLARER
jgi:hypothetical protein